MTPPPPPNTLMLLAAVVAQQVDHVLEELDMPALVGGDRDALHVFLKRGVDDLLYRAVVPEVDHLGARTPGEAGA